MLLNEYMLTDGAMSNRELAEAIKCDPAQIRQWRSLGPDGELQRRPGAAYCVAIEQATGGRVSRADLRPDDWAAIWPELAERARAA